MFRSTVPTRLRQATALAIALLLCALPATAGIRISSTQGLTMTGADGLYFDNASGLTMTGADALAATGAEGVAMSGVEGLRMTGWDGLASVESNPTAQQTGLMSFDPELAVKLDKLTDDSNVNAVVVYHQAVTDSDIA